MVPVESVREVLRHLSFLTHVEPFSKGVVDSADVAWFVLFTFAFLFLTWRSIESRRWR
jgi:ABC-2 type transport system permease protein